MPPPALSGFRCILPRSCTLGEFLAPVARTILVDNENNQDDAQLINATMMLRLATSDSTLLSATLLSEIRYRTILCSGDGKAQSPYLPQK